MQNELIELLREAVLSGGAVCLVGAGYSVTATDQKGHDVPGSADLIKEIKSAVGIEDDEYASLADIADYCEDSPSRERELRQVLIQRLTLCNPSADQRILANQPWRSIFTTNFDDTVERCLGDDVCQVVTPTVTPPVHKTGKVPLYYMHGRAKDLVETDINPRFVIAERNYIQLHDDNRALYTRLKNELFSANRIVIVGYSMRDLEVARILIEGGHAFKNKTIVVCSPTEKSMAVSRLAKFGTVLPIGVSGLVKELSIAPKLDRPNNPSFQFVDMPEPTTATSDISGEDFIKLIITGRFSRENYRAQLQQPDASPELYCIRRTTALDIVLKRSPSGVSRFIVSSDLGNGKSIFLDQLSEELLVNGHRVIRVTSGLPEVFAEIELALSSQQSTAFLIDDAIRYRQVAQFIGTRLNSLHVLVCSMRGDPSEVAFQSMANSLGGAVRQIDLNRLSTDELHNWEVALERWGLWEERISHSPNQRRTFLAEQCASENRSIVLSLFKKSQIAIKIDQIVTFFLRDGRHEKAFAALLISSLCQQHVSWESLVSWLDLDEQKIKSDITKSDISALFTSGRGWNTFTSAQLSEYILRTKYVESDRDTLVDVYSTIVLRSADSASDGHLGLMFRENLKELMKFRFLARLFGEDESAVKLIGTVYSRLSKARLIRENPQFWLQYAMSRMEIPDLDSAETYLNTAFGLAKGRGVDYSPFQIIDQRARLYFKKNSLEGNRLSVSEVVTAIKDLKSLLDDPRGEIIYLYRSAPLIQQFVDTHIDILSEDMKLSIRSLLEDIREKGRGYAKLPRAQKGETKVLSKALGDALITLKYA